MAEARKTSWVLDFKDKASKGIKSVDKSFTGLTSKIKKFDGKNAMSGLASGLKKTSKEMETLSKATRGISLATTAITGKATKDFLDYSSVLSTVKSQAGMTADEIERLDGAIMGMEKRLSSKALAEQAVTLASAGLDGTAIESALPTVDRISTLTEDSTSAPDVLLAGKTHLGIDLEDVQAISKYGDQLAKAQSLANFNIADISESLIEGGASFNSFNMSSRESLATLSVLAELGYKGSRAGTMVNSTLADLISKAEEGNIVLGKQKVALYDSEGRMKKLPRIMSEIKNATINMTEEQRNAVLNQLLGAQSSKLVGNWIAKGTDIYKEHAIALNDVNGQLDKMVDDKTDNLLWDIKSLTESFKDLGITIAKEVAPSLRPMVSGITNITNKLQEANPTVLKTIGFGLLALSAITPILFVGSKLMLGMSKFIGILSLVPTAIGLVGLKLTALQPIIGGLAQVATGGMGWIVAGVVALGVIIYKNWDSIKSWTISLVDKMNTSWTNMANTIREKIDNISNWWNNLRETLKKPLTGFINIFKKDKGESKEDNKPKHRTGKDRVPRDGYDFTAHKDEMVLTRRVANAYRKAGGTSNSLPSTNSNSGGNKITVNLPSVVVNTTGKDAYNDGRQAGRGIRDEIDNYFRDIGFVI